MFAIHYFEKNIAVLSQYLLRIPEVDESIKIKGRKWKVVVMTSVVFVYLMVAPEGFALAYDTGVIIGLSFTVLVAFIYIYQIFKHKAFTNPVFLTED